MTSRKKPGVAFWATVGLAVVLLYMASFAPVATLHDRGKLTEILVVCQFESSRHAPCDGPHHAERDGYDLSGEVRGHT